MAKVLLSKLQIDKLNDRVDENAVIVESVVQQLVEKYCGDLDELMGRLRKAINEVNYPLSDEELDVVALKLASMLYFVSQTLENVGIRLDIARFIRAETYAKIHLETEGTVSNKNAAAEKGTLEETLGISAYDRTYRTIKLRLESAGEMLSTIKKVMNRRQLEQDLPGYTKRGRD